MKKITQGNGSTYPRRLWGIFGFPESGKTTFLTQMRGPIFVVDADFRFDEKLHLLTGKDAYWNESPAENNDPLSIVRALRRDLGAVNIGTIGVDSLTAIIQPYVTEAMLANNAGENKNKAAAFTAKAIAMRALQDGITRFGTDVCWIWHVQHGRDNKANEVVTPTIPAEELARLKRSINMLIHLGRDQKGRYATVEWVHEKGKVNVKLYDETGNWSGMPERIEKAIYDNAQQETQEQPQAVTTFNNLAEALKWAVGLGAYADAKKAREFYEQIKIQASPKTAQDMWDAWIAHCNEQVKQ